jgi:hypothetical protein
MATLILLLSPRNPTAPNVFDRTYFIKFLEKGTKTSSTMLNHEQDQQRINIFTRNTSIAFFWHKENQV